MSVYLKYFTFIICVPLILSAQYDKIKFEHVTTELGLSNNKIRCILQDKYGFVWIGTHDGLCKYDGYEFTVYCNDPADSTSLTSSWITALFEDSSGDIWISTMGGGLNKFDRTHEQFFNNSHYINKHLWWRGTSAITMKQIAEYQYEHEKVLWIGAFNGLHKFNPETGVFTHFPHTEKTAPDAHIQTLVVDKNGMVWIGSLGDGLHKFNPYTKQFTHFRHDPDDKNSLSHNSVHYLFIDHNQILWIATNGGGLNRYDPEKKRFICYRHDPGDLSSISSNTVQSIYEDHLGILWIGTSDEGLNIFNRDTETFRHFLHDPNDPASLANNTVWDIFEDKTGVMWIGTWGGVDKIIPRINQFHDYKKIPENTRSMPDDVANAIYISNHEDREVLWIGTRKGLVKIDRLTGQYTHFVHDPADKTSIPDNIITALFEDQSGILWVGTYEHGLIKFNQKTGQFNSYTHDPENPNSISNNIITSIYEDSQGIFWIGSYDGGLDRFDRDNEIFKLVTTNAVIHMVEDSSSILWAASWPGVKKYDRQKGKFLTYLCHPDAANFPELNRTNYILESKNSKENWLWTATYSGLNRFDRQSGEFINYGANDGLPSNVISSMLEDEQGNLWIGTNSGLSRFNPQNKSFKNFDVSDGLLSNQFSLAACAKSNDGEMFFCTSKGVIAFYPEDIVENQHIPDIVISDFEIFHKSVGIQKNNLPSNDQIFGLDRHISLMQEITLPWHYNILTFKFAALDYNSPQKNKYAYMIEGVDPDWVYTDAAHRFANYMNLDPGNYTFKVKGSNNDGIWNEAGTSIRIIIIPPWWQTDLAYAVYLLLLISIIITTWRLQMRRIKIRQLLKMEHFEAEKLREVDQLKSQFFANISHEFRTPLTLILGPVKQMLSGKFTGNITEQYKMIIRNGERLLGLINQILDISKLESGKMKLQVAETDITYYMKGIVLSFASLAERKGIKLEFTSKNIRGFVDRDKLEKIVSNLLANAFKFAPEGGEVIVECRAGSVASDKFKIQNSKSKIFSFSVTNTGPGIPADQLDRIFDRFYQADNNYKKDGEGTGIGLALTKELVEICYGEISVSSIPDSITTFTVTLPVAEENFKFDEIVEARETEDRRPETGKQRAPDNNTEEETAIQVPEYNFFNPERTTTSSGRTADSGLRCPLILIVEDNPDVTRYICSFMENEYRILTAANGKEGLRKTIAEYPDLIISDVMMPEMDGFELCTNVKTDERISHIPVILLTARADLDSKMDGLEFGADDYVTKPFEMKELQIRSKNLIEQRLKLREKFSQLNDLNPEDISVTSADEKLLQRLLNVFENHIEEPDFTTEAFAREVGMSRMNLNQKLQALVNQSTNEFLRTLRLKRAAVLLNKYGGTVSEIAYKVGFNNTSYFARAFRKIYGVSPSRYIKKNKHSHH